MESPSPPDAELQTRVRQQEIVADLGQQALQTDGLDPSKHDVAVSVAETLDDEYAEVLELLVGEERVFEVFERLQGHDHAVTGIGLALCERIVERHDGDIRVESEPSEGATFPFTLPAGGESDG